MYTMHPRQQKQATSGPSMGWYLERGYSLSASKHALGQDGDAVGRCRRNGQGIWCLENSFAVRVSRYPLVRTLYFSLA